MEQCPSCKDFAVEVDSSFLQKVCTSCGEVLSDQGGIYTDSGGFKDYDRGPVVTSHAKKRAFSSCLQIDKPQWVAEGKLNAHKRLRCLFSTFFVPKNMETTCKNMLDAILKDSPFRTMANENKIAVAVCILYATLRQNDWPITIRTLCDAAHVDKVAFSKLYADVLDYFKLSITTPSLEELVPMYLKESTLKNDTLVSNLTMDLLELSRETWLTYGKRPDALISAVVYIAWIAGDVNQRIKTQYGNFCKQNRLRSIDIALVRVRELMKVLTKLCLELPWNKTKKEMSKREVLFSLHKVLKYQKSLLLDLKSNSATAYPFVGGKKAKLDAVAKETPVIIGTVNESPELTEDDIPSSELHEFIRSEAEVKQIENSVCNQLQKS